ncbi:hypothetical protein [Thioclava sp. GXIMD4216]|uniref:Resolvase, N terminal domain n=1 Tax=Thioclava litoralis TaxID=3076557 RepID=A0ABZ1E1H9_9RHOB|nr:hypothetical protein RPE78_01135 [Thioclava sp. FTW29]
MQQILRMIFNQLLRRGINYGINKGIERASRKGRNDDTPLTPEERRKQQQLRKMAGNARRLARMTKLGRRF